MEIVSEDDASVVEAKHILEERKKERDLVYEQKICLDYLEKIPHLTPAKAEAMKQELATITILKPRYITIIINVLPETEEEVEMLFSKERTNLKKEEVKQIVAIVGKYRK